MEAHRRLEAYGRVPRSSGGAHSAGGMLQLLVQAVATHMDVPRRIAAGGSWQQPRKELTREQEGRAAAVRVVGGS